jgi:hypothetical protein
MTASEQKSINAIALKQATMEQKQLDMVDDIHDIKETNKSLVEGQEAILLAISSFKNEASELYVSKKAVKYLIGLAISVGVLAVQVYDHIFKK